MGMILYSRWTVLLQLEWRVLLWTLWGRYCTADGQWFCRLNGVCYSEHYVEGTAQPVDSGIAGWMECVTVNIMWKILHSRWTVVLQVEWSVLLWTLCGRYCKAGGQYYCRLSGLCYSEHYVEDTAQQVDSGIACWMECVTVNIMWKILHSMWTVVLQVEWSVLLWTLCWSYCTPGGQWYCRLNGVCYSEHCVEVTAQQVDSGIAAWMECVTVNIMWKVLHSRWTVVLQVEWIVLLWTLFGRYCTASWQWYCSLNGVCYSEHYLEDTEQQVDSGFAAWMECVTVNILWKVLHSMWTLNLQLEWNVLQWTLCGRYCTAGLQWYCRLNGVCYSEHYVEGTAQQVDSDISGWMECVTANIMLKILHSRWTVLLQLEWSVLLWTLCGSYFTAGGQ